MRKAEKSRTQPRCVQPWPLHRPVARITGASRRKGCLSHANDVHRLSHTLNTAIIIVYESKHVNYHLNFISRASVEKKKIQRFVHCTRGANTENLIVDDEFSFSLKRWIIQAGKQIPNDANRACWTRAFN